MLLLSVLSACIEQQPPLPEKIEGMWELHALEIREGGAVDGLTDLLEKYPGCSWGRRTWTFDADHIEAGLDILCPADKQTYTPPVPVEGAGSPEPKAPVPEGSAPSPTAPGTIGEPSPDEPLHEFFGCQVTVRVPAIWDTEAGSWKVEHRAKATSRTRGRDADAIGVPTSCDLEIPMGDYAVARVPKQPWRWEMLTPDNVVYRLKLPDSDRPDFVAALRALGEGAGTQPPGASGAGTVGGGR